MHKNRILCCICALCLCASLCTTALASGQTFSDVPEGQWYYTWVTKAAQAGWVSGVGGGRYEPGKSVTFSQFAVMLDRALYADDMAAQPAGAYWWTPACEVADRHGLFADTDMANRSDWTVVANKPIEREQMAQMMYNALVDVGAKLPSYAEYSEVALGIADIIDCDNYDAVAVCYTLKLLNGTGNGNFDPHSDMTRAQAAVVLCNIYGYVTGDVTGSEPEKPTEPETPVEPEKPTQPDVPRPAGAVGGRYDTNKYTVPADANKDGWLTEDEVAAVIAQIMDEYPEGTPWGDDKTYRSSNWPWSGSGCAAFAMMASDRIFGNLPIRKQMDAYSIRIGDATENRQPHWSVIRKIWWYDEDPAQSVTYTIDGNSGGKIGAGVGSFGDIDHDVKNGGMTIWTRYPAEK